nr:N-6 DNA methylase [Planosporangium thailandense]
MLWGSRAEPAVSEPARNSFTREIARDGDIGDSYCRSVTPDLRHRLGEHYTPGWLVRRIASQVPERGVAADPACGDGRFLVALLERGRRPEELWGADLNPLAVMMARINVWRALGRPGVIPPVSIVWGDFALGPDAAEAPPCMSAAVANIADVPQASVYIGNPPWVTWRNLSDDYRDAVAARMAGSRLNHARGWAARISAGQTDMAHIFVHEAVERLAPEGQIAFVLPRSTFKAPVGPGRLREGVSTAGRKYRFTRIWDCADSDPFTGVRMDAVVAFIDADQPHGFPVEWTAISADGSTRPPTVATLSDPDDPASPWLTSDPSAGGLLRLAPGRRWTELRARGGVNTGGGNSVFHVDVVEEHDGNLTIRNVPSRRSPLEVFTAEVEATYVRPLLRGHDVRAWKTAPSGHIVLPHDGDLRKAVNEARLLREAPLTYAYLAHFKEVLAARKEVARWNPETWYTLFRIGPYTGGCWRVVWPHSANRNLRAAILAPDDPTVPDQKVVLVPFDSQGPALFLCALLNSSVVRRSAAASAGIDASPNLVRRLILPRYESNDVRHRLITALAASLLDGSTADQGELDEAVAALFTR